MTEPVTITLRNPIPHGKETTIEALTFRPPVAKDFRRLPLLEGYEMDTMLVLAGRLSAQPDVVIDKLAGDDLKEVLEAVSGFMEVFRVIGSKS
jgi:hypothetical protein